MRHTTGHIVAHFVTQVPSPHGVEWSSWVAAGAAVVQAIGAVAAIWYSGKLARDAAAREIAADAAAERRLAAQAAAGAEQRRLDREEDERRRSRQSVEDHNSPIELALDLSQAAFREITDGSAENAAAVRRGERNLRYAPSGPLQILAYEQLPKLVEKASDAVTKASIKSLRDAFEPFNPLAALPPTEWTNAFARRRATIDHEITNLRARLRAV